MSTDLTNKKIRNTYQRLIQKSGSLFYDGLGNQIDLGNGSIDSGSFITTSSFNAFTASYYTASSSFDDRINNVSIDTSSLVLDTTFNTFTSSYYTASSSFDNRIDELTTASSSFATEIDELFTASSSFDTRIDDVAKGITSVYLNVRNNSGGTITAGTPIYSQGEVGSSGVIRVSPANSTDASKMPAIGVITEDLTNNQDGHVIINGIFNENISGFSGLSLGDTIYVGSGSLTATKPSGTDLIQNIGTIIKTNGSQIQGMKVSSIDRTNDVPNLEDKHIFFGDGIHAPATHLSTAVASTILTDITASGNISSSGDLFTNNITASGNITAGGEVSTDTLNVVNNAVMGSDLEVVGELQASNIVYPTTDGIIGQVMTTDGAGNLSFTTPSSGGGGSTHTYNLSMQIGVNSSNYYYGNLNYGWNYIIWSSHDTDMALFHTNQGSGMPANDDYTKISLVGHAINTSRAGQTLRYRLWKTPLVFSGNTSMTILAEDDIIMTSQNVYYPIDFNATGLTINKGDLIFLSVNDTSWVGNETIRNSLAITLSN